MFETNHVFDSAHECNQKSTDPILRVGGPRRTSRLEWMGLTGWMGRMGRARQAGGMEGTDRVDRTSGTDRMDPGMNS